MRSSSTRARSGAKPSRRSRPSSTRAQFTCSGLQARSPHASRHGPRSSCRRTSRTCKVATSGGRSRRSSMPRATSCTCNAHALRGGRRRRRGSELGHSCCARTPFPPSASPPLCPCRRPSPGACMTSCRLRRRSSTCSTRTDCTSSSTACRAGGRRTLTTSSRTRTARYPPWPSPTATAAGATKFTSMRLQLTAIKGLTQAATRTWWHRSAPTAPSPSGLRVRPRRRAGHGRCLH